MRKKGCMGQRAWGGTPGFPALSRHTTLRNLTCSALQKLSKPCPSGFFGDFTASAWLMHRQPCRNDNWAKREWANANRLCGEPWPVSSDSSWSICTAFFQPWCGAGLLLKWGSCDLLSDNAGQRISLWPSPRQKGEGRSENTFRFYDLPWGEKGAEERRTGEGQREGFCFLRP